MPWTHTVSDLNGEEILGMLYKKELQKTNLEEFRFEKTIKRKGDKLYIQWEGYNKFFNSWIEKRDIFIQNKIGYFQEPYNCNKSKIKIELD